MNIVSEGDELFYDVRGEGAPVVLLHPFPANHRFWEAVVPSLEQRYQLILPDLRGHADSPPGNGPATMAKHALDLARLCNELGINKAIFAGVSIGGYILFEFLRRSRARGGAFVFGCTRAGGRTAEGRADPEKTIRQTEQR